MGKYIIFSCHEQNFALPIDVTDKILLFEKPTKVPDTSQYLLGLLPYEEKRIAVIDLKERLFHENLQPNEQSKIIVVHWKGMKLGLAVENVTTVREFESQDPSHKQEDEAETTKYIVEMFQTEEGITMHLDVEHLLSDKGMQEIKTILDK